jgi:SAM-dependent methyltransferase
LSSRAADDDIAELESSILEFLDARAPAGADDAYVLKYTRDRYSAGLEKYVSLLRSLGFEGMRCALDVGSGAGHWCIAFAQISEEADGIDSHAGFVDLGRRLAAHVGLDDRVRLQVGSAEELPFEDATFEAVWTHGVLMFTETELAMREMARVLIPGGIFYCGYSSFGFRLNALYRPLVKDLLPGVKAQVANLLGDRLYRAGLHSNPWSRTRAFTLEELIDIADVFGMRFVDEPGVQDTRGVAFGHPTTVDFIARRQASASAHAEDLMRADWSEELAAELGRLIELGCGRVVIDVLETRNSPGDRTTGALLLRALVKSGQSSSRTAKRLAQNEPDPVLRGLFFHDRREYKAALESYSSADERSSPDVPFLRGCALLALDRDADAETVLEHGVATGKNELACRIALLEPPTRRGDLPEIKRRFADVLELVAGETGSLEQAGDLISALR